MTDATWSNQPGSSDWNNAANWTPATVPTDTATFNSSSTTAISFSQTGATVGAIVFSNSAPEYSFNFGTTSSPSLSIGGAGVSNSSSFIQSFVVAATSTGHTNTQLQFTGTASAGGSNLLYRVGPETPQGYGGGVLGFLNNSTAGSANFVVTTGAGTPPQHSTVGGEVSFGDTSSASSATFTIYGSTSTTDGDTFGNVVFHQNSTAAQGTFTNIGGTVYGGDGGNTQFYDSSTAANGVFNNRGGTTSGANGGDVAFDGTANGGYGQFYNFAAPASGAYGGVTSFNNNYPYVSLGGASAGNGCYVNYGANGQDLGGGGHVSFSAKYGSPTAGTATFINYGSSVNSSSSAGHTIFSSTPGGSYYPTAGNATFYNYGAQTANGAPGYTEFTVYGSATGNYPRAGRGMFLNEGGVVSGAAGGRTIFYSNSRAENAVLIAYAGTNGGYGGQIIFADQSSGDAASIALNGNAKLVLNEHQGPLTIERIMMSNGTIVTNLGTNTTTLNLTYMFMVIYAPITFELTTDSGFQAGTSYPILTAFNVGSLQLSWFAATTTSGLTPTFSISGNTLYVTLN